MCMYGSFADGVALESDIFGHGIGDVNEPLSPFYARGAPLSLEFLFRHMSTTVTQRQPQPRQNRPTAVDIVRSHTPWPLVITFI
jgi:hypothetical protein